MLKTLCAGFALPWLALAGLAAGVAGGAWWLAAPAAAGGIWLCARRIARPPVS